jgi:hypothetical protein
VKKLFTIITVFLLGTVCFAQTPSNSSVVVTPITANYNATPPTVTFEVSWSTGSRDVDHRSKVWILVDYRRIQNNAYTGGWSRAEINTLPVVNAGPGTVTLATGNTKGFWLQGTSDAFDFAATVTVPVTVDLVGYAPQFAWCGVASDRPPYAEEMSAYYALNGTQPFIIQTHPANTSSTVSVNSTAYNDCIYSLTDATNSPDSEWPPMPVITGFTTSATTICAGQSVTLSATATNAKQYSFDNGLTWGSSSSIEVSPAAAATYILKATREKGACTVISSDTITVTVNDLPVVASVSSATACAGSTSILTATVSGGTTSSMSYTWTIGTAAATTTETNTITTQKLYAHTAFTVTVTNANGCTSEQNSGTISITSPAASGQTANACGCASSLENCSGTCKPDCCTNCASWTTCGFTQVSSVAYENIEMDWSTANTFCQNKSTGWRLPTLTELKCMCQNGSGLPNGYVVGYTYWSSTLYDEGYYYSVSRDVNKNCIPGANKASVKRFVKCVK